MTKYNCGDMVWAVNEQSVNKFVVLQVHQTMNHPESTAYRHGSDDVFVEYLVCDPSCPAEEYQVSLEQRHVFGTKKDLLESL